MNKLPDDLWDTSEAAIKAFAAPALKDGDLAMAEAQLGFKLPATYVELLRGRNGGNVLRSSFPSPAPDVIIDVEYICGIGGPFGLVNDDDTGSRYMIAEWGYPEIGIAFAYTPSAGHEVIMLDYRACGPNGEPTVVYIDIEAADPTPRTIANNFADFVNALRRA